MRKLFVNLAVLLLWAVVAVPPALAVGTLAGSAISNQAYSDYDDVNGNARPRVYSNAVLVTVSQVAGIDITPDSATQNGIAGTDVAYGTTLYNLGNGPDTITFTATNIQGWTVTIYRDDNGDGIHQPSETTVVGTTGELAADAGFKVFVVTRIPVASANGDVGTTSITGTSTFNSTVTDTSTFTTNVQAASLNLSKSASPAAAKPGEIITYAIAGSNSGAGFAYNVRAIDTIPANTTFVPGSMKAGPIGGTYAAAFPMTDANDAENLTYTVDGHTTVANAYFDAGAKLVQLDWSQCLPAGVFYFQVRVKNNVTAGTTISNTITASYSLLVGDLTRPYTESSNGATTSVSNAPGVLLSPDRIGTGDPGDQMVYTFIAQNTGNAPDTIDLTSTSSLGWNWVLWKDVDGNGIPGTDGDAILTDTNADGKIDTGIIPQGGTVSLLAVATVPPGSSNGAVDTSVLTGASSIDPAITDPQTLTTTVQAPVLSMDKGLTAVQAPGGGAICTPTNPANGAGCTIYPGSILTYTVTTTNAGSGNATSVVTADLIPQFTTYRAGTIKTGSSIATLTTRTDGNDADGAWYNSAASSVICPDGSTLTLGAAGTWVLQFQVTVN